MLPTGDEEVCVWMTERGHPGWGTGMGGSEHTQKPKAGQEERPSQHLAHPIAARVLTPLSGHGN